jgi:hypothetical protein
MKRPAPLAFEHVSLTAMFDFKDGRVVSLHQNENFWVKISNKDPLVEDVFYTWDWDKYPEALNFYFSLIMDQRIDLLKGLYSSKEEILSINKEYLKNMPLINNRWAKIVSKNIEILNDVEGILLKFNKLIGTDLELSQLGLLSDPQLELIVEEVNAEISSRMGNTTLDEDYDVFYNNLDDEVIFSMKETFLNLIVENELER